MDQVVELVVCSLRQTEWVDIFRYHLHRISLLDSMQMYHFRWLIDVQ
jgi:hypothetical protein